MLNGALWVGTVINGHLILPLSVSLPLCFSLWLIIISHIPSVPSEHWGLWALVCSNFPHRFPSFLAHPRILLSPLSSCYPVSVCLCHPSSFFPSNMLCPPPCCCPCLSPPECRIAGFQMNERLDSMKRMMAQLNVPLRNAPLCCGVFWPQLRLQSSPCYGGLRLSCGDFTLLVLSTISSSATRHLNKTLVKS